MITRSLILCRYNEDISWVDNLDKTLNVFVYDKSPNVLEKQFCYKTENVGRECSAYLEHIVKNYDNLTGQLYFSQAFPFPHIPDYLEILGQQLSLDTIQNGFKWVGPRIKNDIANNLDWGSQFTMMPNSHPNPFSSSIKNIWESVFETPCPEINDYCVSGNFFVQRENILRHNKEKYKKLLKITSYPEQKEFSGVFKSNCIECHFLERMWGKIFE